MNYKKYRSCYSKKAYKTMEQAIKAVKNNVKIFGNSLRIYLCSCCGEHHTTKQLIGEKKKWH